MFTECAVFCSATPICSAIAMKRLLNTSSMHRIGAVPSASRAGRGSTRAEHERSRAVSSRRPAGVDDYRGGRLDETAGPATRSPGRRCSRSKRRSGRAAVRARARMVTVCRRERRDGGARPDRSSGSSSRPRRSPRRHGLDDERPTRREEREAARGGRPRTRRRMSACRPWARRARCRCRRSGCARVRPCGAPASVLWLCSRGRQPRAPRRRHELRHARRRGRASTARCAHRPQVGEAHPVGREHARQRMDEHRVMASASATGQACCPPAPPKRRARSA